MATELDNRFFINGTEYKYAVDSTPIPESTLPIESNAVYQLYDSVQTFVGRRVVNETSQFLENSTNIPTVGLIWQILKNNNVI